jgi:hypothetical protein
MDGANKIKVFALAIFSMLIFSLTFVAAQATQPVWACSIKDCLPGFSKALYLLFGFPSDQSIGVLIAGVFIFFIIAFGIIDIVTLISPLFSKKTIYFIGFGLAFIVAFTRLLAFFAIWAFSFVAGMGTLAIIIELVITFGISIALSFGSWRAWQFAMKKRIQAESLRAAGEAAKGWRKLAGFEKLTE